MASLTPGTLSKLLHQTTTTPTTSDHRSPLLQIIGILPSNPTDDNIYHTSGFYLRLSDSLHSAYVSVSDEDVELILTDKIQLGQFVHVAWLEDGSPVPVVKGLKVVPKRRECVGTPVDLISSDVLWKKKKLKKKTITTSSSLRRVSLGNVKNDGLDLRRLSLDSSRKGWDRSGCPPGSSHSASSVSATKNASSEKNLTLKHQIFSPLKQVVPHRRSFSEKDIAVKPPSPRISPLKQVLPHRKSLSERDIAVKPPSPRISPLKQVLPNRKSLSEKDSTCRPPSPRISPVQHGLSNKSGGSERDFASKHHSSSHTSQFKHVPPSINQLSEKKSTLKPLNVGISPLQNKNVIDSSSPLSKPVRKETKQSAECTSHLSKVPLSFKTWSDAKISWGSLPSKVHDLGKEVSFQRNARFLDALYALQETSAMENVLQCMRVFSELCESSDKESSLPLVEEYLNFHQTMQRVATAVNSLLSVRSNEEDGTCYNSLCSLSETCKEITDKNALSWVQAAVVTNLSKFNLFTKEDKKGDFNSEKCHYVILDNTPIKIDVENHSPDKKRNSKKQRAVMSGSSLKTSSPYHSKQRLSTTKKEATKSEEWSKGNGLTVAVNLAQKLLSTSQAWFLDYLEASLEKGFGLQKGEKDSEIACLLGQLKRVNQWLDDSVTDQNGTNERIEGLKKKLYGFLLDNVDSTVAQTGS